MIYSFRRFINISHKLVNSQKVKPKIYKISGNQTEVCIIPMYGNEYGIYHVSCEGSCTRYEFAKKILELTGRDVAMIKPVLAKDIKGDHQRPLNSVLENLMMKMTGIYKMPKWEDDLNKYLELRGMKHGK